MRLIAGLFGAVGAPGLAWTQSAEAPGVPPGVTPGTPGAGAASTGGSGWVPTLLVLAGLGVLTGRVPDARLHAIAVQVAREEARTLHPDIELDDRVVVEPAPARRVA